VAATQAAATVVAVVGEAAAAAAVMAVAAASRKVAASHARIQAIHKVASHSNSRHATRMRSPHAHATRRSAMMTPNPPAMSPPASPLPASPRAATAATTAAADAQPAAVVAADVRVALVLGATGLVGREILARLLADKTYAAVHCVGRRKPEVVHAKLVSHLSADFATFESPAVDDVFIALGTTIKVAGSQQAFRAVDFDAVLAVARSARAAGARRLGIVSAMGADARSTVFYNRVKGEMENAVSRLAYDRLVLARPSLLTGDRQSLAQAHRPAEKFAAITMQLLKPLTPVNYRTIAAGDVAAALIRAVQAAVSGQTVLLSGEMQPR
jgi:uncharacterized protein YbjT (DUF2867 family)